MLTLGGSVATTTIPPSFVALQDPGLIKVNADLNALAIYYNTTLAQIATGNYANASFLLNTFHFVNIPPSVNATAQLANSDLAVVNNTAANATVVFQQADLAIKAKEYINATILVNEGCALTQQANRSLADFQGPRTTYFMGESVPVAQYSQGSALAADEVRVLVAKCNALRGILGFGSGLLIGSPQTAIETGGTVKLDGNLTLKGSGVPGQEVRFYINGSYFGSIRTVARGDLAGTLGIPFVYPHFVVVQAFVASNSTVGLGGAASNTIIFEILFNQTAIVVGDPPAVLPTFAFGVHGNLTTVSGTPLPNAPVKVTFFHESQILHTDTDGAFATRLTVPANATDGIYNVNVSFAPQGVFGPSFNFTTIQVVHLPMRLTINAPPLSLAGLSTTLTGHVRSNGSAVAGAAITVSSPWGSVGTTTNSTGGFRVGLPVSPLEFALSRNITISGSAQQPFIANGILTKSVGLFNVLAVILPAAAVGIIGYEADKLGVFEGLRNRSRQEQTAVFEDALAEPEPARIPALAGGPELVEIYRRALSLAASKLSIRFRPCQTIREIISLVGAKESGVGADAFREVMLTVEDFLYAPNFDASRLDSARRRLAEVEGHWE